MAVLDIPARKAVQQMTIIPTKEKLTSSSIASWTDLQILLPRFSEQTLLFYRLERGGATRPKPPAACLG
jgi:hypothetical protein